MRTAFLPGKYTVLTDVPILTHSILIFLNSLEATVPAYLGEGLRQLHPLKHHVSQILVGAVPIHWRAIAI